MNQSAKREPERCDVSFNVTSDTCESGPRPRTESKNFLRVSLPIR